MINGSIHQKYITIKNVYGPNSKALKYRKEILTELKEKINSNNIRRFQYFTLFIYNYIYFLIKILILIPV